MRNARAGASGWSRQPAALLPADKRAERAMEPDQAGAVESPGALLSHRYVPGLNGLFSGRRRGGTPTRRERVEQESPLLWPVSRSLLLRCHLAPNPCLQASTPIKGGRWPPGGLSRLRR
jgi:hypothetical protein